MADCSKQEMSIADSKWSIIREIRGDNEREKGEILRMGREVEIVAQSILNPMRG